MSAVLPVICPGSRVLLQGPPACRLLSRLCCGLRPGVRLSPFARHHVTAYAPHQPRQ